MSQTLEELQTELKEDTELYFELIKQKQDKTQGFIYLSQRIDRTMCDIDNFEIDRTTCGLW